TRRSPRWPTRCGWATTCSNAWARARRDRTAPMSDQRRVVIVGGGFAGVGAARRLAKHDDVGVTLLDRNNYHQFQPLLYQVATSQLAPSDIAFSLRKLFHRHPNVDVKRVDVASIDPATHTVTTTDGAQLKGDAIVL